MEDFLKGEAGPVFLFLYLLPGFLGAVVYDYLVERDKPTNFERIIDALVLTLVSSVIVHIIIGLPLLPDITLSKDTSAIDVLKVLVSKNIFYISICSIVISILFSWLNNHDIIYYVLNRIGLTYQNGGWDVWQDTFYKHRRYWIRLRFSDGRSLIGWPKFYSRSGEPRELFIAEATWWETDSTGGTPIESEVKGAGVYISDFSNVIGIELLE